MEDLRTFLDAGALRIDIWPKRRRLILHFLRVVEDDDDNQNIYVQAVQEALSRIDPTFDLIFDYTDFEAAPLSQKTRTLVASVSAAILGTGRTRIHRVLPERLDAYFAPYAPAIAGTGLEAVVVRTLEEAHADLDRIRAVERHFEDERMVIDVWPETPRVVIKMLHAMAADGDNRNLYAERIGQVLERFGPSLQLIVDYSDMRDAPLNADAQSWVASTTAAFKVMGVRSYVRVVPERLDHMHARYRKDVTVEGVHVVVVRTTTDAHAYFDDV